MTVRNIMGKETPLVDIIGGKVALIVNVASKCGYTPQYEGLEALYAKYKDRGLVVLGCPCNQFGGQEPGTEEEVHTFACSVFKTTFPMTAKMDVNGDKAHPMWLYMQKEKTGLLGTQFIKWNFSKFLVDRTGKVVQRFGSNDKPEALEKFIAELL